MTLAIRVLLAIVAAVLSGLANDARHGTPPTVLLQIFQVSAARILARMPAMSTAPSLSRFKPSIVDAIHKAKILGVRAGRRTAHRFTGVWVVVVNGRVFARSWGVTPGGWYSTFRDHPEGTIQVGVRRLRVRARPVRGPRILDAVEQAYAAKYPTPASKKWVRGFRATRRREATLEFIPASAAQLADEGEG